MTRTKKIAIITLSLALILLMTTFCYAGENTGNEQINLKDIEFEITKDNLDKDGHFVIEIPQEETVLSEGMIEGSAPETMAIESKKLPSIVVEGYAKKSTWEGSTLELSIGCKATGGKLKSYRGTCNIYNANGIRKIKSKNYYMRDSNGRKTLVDHYKFKMGNYKSCRVKLSNQIAVDIYERSGSLYSYQSGLIRK